MKGVPHTFGKPELALMITDGLSSEREILYEYKCAIHREMWCFAWSHATEDNLVATFLNPLVLYLSASDLICLRLMIFLQFLGILHLLPLRLVEITLQIHTQDDSQT